jgi:hypothetical protein
VRPFLAAATLAVLALLAWLWARGADPARTAPANGEGSGEPEEVVVVAGETVPAVIEVPE